MSKAEPLVFMKKFQHRVLAFAAPYLFLAALVFILGDIVPGFPRVGWFFFLAVAVAGFTQVTLSTIFSLERSGAAVRFQSAALFFLATYAVAVALTSKPFPDRLLPGLGGIAAVIGVILQWTWSSHFLLLLGDREELLRHLEGKDGHELHAAMRDASELTLSAMRNIGGVSKSVSAALVSILVLFIVAFATGARIGPAGWCATAGFCLLGLILTSLARLYGEEQYFAGLGLSAAFSLTADRVRGSVVLLSGALVLAILVSSASSLLPFAWLVALFNAILALFNRLPVAPIPPPRQPEASPGPDLHEGLDKLAASIPAKTLDLTLFFAIVKYLFLAAAVICALYFLFGPFFKREFRRFVAEGRLGAYIRRLASVLRSILGNLFGGKKRDSGPLLRADSRRAMERSILDRIRRVKSPEKRREIGALTRRFLEIVEWGGKRGFAYTASLGPGEFGAMLAIAVPRVGHELDTAGFLFEKALYADGLLSPAELGAYGEAVDAVLADEIDEGAEPVGSAIP
jgi:hypothetical protein